MKPILLEEVSSPGCHSCRAFREWWDTMKQEYPNVTIKEVDLTTDEGQALVQKHMIFASPGIIVNGELFSTGGVDKEKFLAKIKELS
ncbi:MAG: thioredoxin family protein [Patescibacteria group bacterium]